MARGCTGSGRVEDGISARIADLRTRRGYTQEQLAHLVGASQHQISRLESGRWRPHKTARIKLARWLRVRVGSLFPQHYEWI